MESILKYPIAFGLWLGLNRGFLLPKIADYAWRKVDDFHLHIILVAVMIVTMMICLEVAGFAAQAGLFNALY